VYTCVAVRSRHANDSRKSLWVVLSAAAYEMKVAVLDLV